MMYILKESEYRLLELIILHKSLSRSRLFAVAHEKLGWKRKAFRVTLNNLLEKGYCYDENRLICACVSLDEIQRGDLCYVTDDAAPKGEIAAADRLVYRGFVAISVLLMILVIAVALLFGINKMVDKSGCKGTGEEYESVQKFSHVPNGCTCYEAFMCCEIYVDSNDSEDVTLSITGVRSYAHQQSFEPEELVIPRDDSVREKCDNIIDCAHDRAHSEKSALISDIGATAFYGCDYLKTVTVPDTVVEIHRAAFANCKNLTAVYLPEHGIKIINESTFEGCEMLEAISLPLTTESICSRAFANCVSMKCITLPDSLRTIAPDAFCGCNITIYAPQKESFYGYSPTSGVTWVVIR